mgnify:CR=1 FL=1
MQISIDESDDTDGADLACPFFVERSGAHGRLEKLPERGMTYSMKVRVISLLEKGLTPSDVIKRLLKADLAPGDNCTMPTLKQVQNQKQQLKTQKTSKLGVTTVHSMRKWAQDHLVTSKEEFDRLGPHDTCVLKIFDSPFEKDGQMLTSVGFVHSSPSALVNFVQNIIPNMPVDQNTGLTSVTGLTDTTFRMISENMVEAQFGCRGLVRNSSGKIRQTFVNVLNAVSRTEKQITYEEMLGCIGIITAVTGIDTPPYNVEFISGDNCDGLINGVEGLDLGRGKCTIAGICWPHMARQTLRNQSDKFQDKEYMPEAQKHMTLLHQCRSVSSYLVMFPLVMTKWREAGEDALATYFEKEFYKKNWGVFSSGVPGQDCNNNPIESNHRDSKRGKWDMAGKKVPLAIYLNESLPLKYAYEDGRRKNQAICYTQLPHDRPTRHILAKAKDLVELTEEGN